MNAVTTKTADAAIIEAWGRRLAAYEAFAAASEAEGPYTEAEQVQWAIIDGAELVIRTVTATSPYAAELQLWCALYHTVTGNEATTAALRADLDWFHKHDDELDWNVKMTVSALRSLRAMGREA